MPPFSVRTTAHFDRLTHKLSRHHQELADRYAQAIQILSADPYNHARQHHIKKLEGIPSGEGQYRLSLGRWRFRYDISNRIITLHYCGLRREETYRR